MCSVVVPPTMALTTRCTFTGRMSDSMVGSNSHNALVTVDSFGPSLQGLGQCQVLAGLDLI